MNIHSKNTSNSTLLKLYLSLILFISCTLLVEAQCGNNILFIVDDSGSVSNSERAQMQISIQQLSDEIYAGNSNSKVGIVQYGQEFRAASSDYSYYITLPLTINPTILLENDPDGNIFISDVLPNSIGDMINDGLFSSGGEFETVNSIFIFTDAAIVGQLDCSSVLFNCGGTCNVTTVSCGYDYLFDLSESLGSIPISVFRVTGSDGTASGIEQNGGVLIEGSNFIISDAQIAQLTESLSCINAGFEFSNTCVGDVTSFTILINQTIDSVLWDFGDGSTSTDPNPDHTYMSPGTYTVTLTVTSDTETVVETAEVTISETPIANAVSDYRVCDDDSNDGVATFDLSTKDAEVIGSQTDPDLTVRYFASNADAENNQSALNTNYSSLSNLQEIFVRIYNSNNIQCYSITSFFLIVDAQPIANTVSDFVVCDDDSADGVETFNLGDKNLEVLGSQSNSIFNVDYYTSFTNAQNGTDELPLSYTSTSNNQTIFVKVSNSINPSCFDIISFSLVVNSNPRAFPVTDYTVCENDRPFIDLNQFNSEILNGQSNVNLSVNYYTSQQDAADGFSPIIGEYEITTSPEVVFVKVENTVTGCRDINSFNLVTYAFPFDDYEAFTICDPSNFLLDTTVEGTSVTYMWEDGSTDPTLVVNDFGTYNVTLTVDSCTTTRQLEVIKANDCFIPQGISPDGDGKNDTFDVSFLDIKEITIYNRYGTRVYRKENYRNEWNGQSDKGHELPSGTYFYVLTKDDNTSVAGWVYLSR